MKFWEIDWKLIEWKWKKEISINNIKVKYYSKEKENFCKFFNLNSFYTKDFTFIDYKIFIQILNDLEWQNQVDYDRIYKNIDLQKNRKNQYLKKTFKKFVKLWILFEIKSDEIFKLNEKIAYKWDKFRQAILKQYYFENWDNNWKNIDKNLPKNIDKKK